MEIGVVSLIEHNKEDVQVQTKLNLFINKFEDVDHVHNHLSLKLLE